MLARRIACTPRYPVPCGRNPLALAYGFPLGKLVRSLAPIPEARDGELPVDFRYCQSSSCALPGPDAGLTSSRRRVTVFTAVEDLRRAGGVVRVTYWLYRPGLGWERIVRSAGAAEIAAASRPPARSRGRSGAGPARDPPRPRPLPVPAWRGAALALANPLPPGDLGRVLLRLPVRAAQQAAPVGGAKDEDEGQRRRGSTDQAAIAICWPDREGEDGDRALGRPGSPPAAPAGRRRRPA